MANRLLTFQWQHGKKAFLVLVLGPGLDSISPSINKIKNTNVKEKKNQNSHVTVIRILVIRDNIINFTTEQTSGYTPLININWHNNTLMTLGHLYQPSEVNISYKYAKTI